eukprot:4982168-Heterocapsa_arctica.AAC.1
MCIRDRAEPRRARASRTEPVLKKPKTTAFAACLVLVEAFVTERAWEESEVKKTPIGKELNLKEVRDWDKMNASLLKEWTTWSKYAAVDIIPAAKSKNIDPTLILDTRI